MSGAAGTGKSRLAAEVCDRLVETAPDWQAGFADYSELPAAAVPDSPMLLVCDYPERCPAAIGDFLSRVWRHRREHRLLAPVRIVLVARHEVAWYDTIRARCRNLGQLISHRVTLTPGEFSADELQRHAQSALAAYCEGYRIPEGQRPILKVGREDLDRPLLIHIAVLLLVWRHSLRQTAIGPGEHHGIGTDDTELLDDLISAEVQRLLQLRVEGIDDGPPVFTRSIEVREALCVTTLTAPVRGDLPELLGCTESFGPNGTGNRSAASDALLRCFPATDADPQADPWQLRIAPVEPDLIASHLLAHTPGRSEILKRLVKSGPVVNRPEYNAQLMSALALAAEDHPAVAADLERHLDTALEALIEDPEHPTGSLTDLLRERLVSLVRGAVNSAGLGRGHAAQYLATALDFPAHREDPVIKEAAAEVMRGGLLSSELPALTERVRSLAAAAVEYGQRVPGAPLARAWRLYARGQRLQGRGRIIEATAALEEALRLLGWEDDRPPVPGTARARLTALVLITRSTGLSSSGDPQSGLELVEKADRLVHSADRGMLLHQRAFILWQSGELDDALRWFDAAEPHLARNGPDWLYAGLFLNRSAVWRDLGELRKGLESAQRAVDLYTDTRSPVHRAKAMHMEGLLWLDLGDVPRALQTFDQVRDQYREHAPELEGYLHSSYADALLSVGMYSRAAEYWSDAIADMRQTGNRRGAAINEFWRAIAGFEDRQPERDAAISQFWRAIAGFENQQFEQAEAWARQAMESLCQQGNESMALLTHLMILQAQFDSGRESPDFADKVSRTCDALEARGWTLRLVQARVLAARAHLRSGNLDEAEAWLDGPPGSQADETLAERLAWHLAKAELAEARSEDPMPHLREGLGILDARRGEFGSVEFHAGVSAVGIELANNGLFRAGCEGSAADALEWTERSRAQVLHIPLVKSSADLHMQEALGQLRQARQQVWDLLAEGKDPTEALQRVQGLEERIRTYDQTMPGPGRQSGCVTPEALHSLARERDTVLVAIYGIAGKLRAVLAGGDELRQVELMDIDQAAEVGRRLGTDLDTLGTGYRLPDRLRLSVERSLGHNAVVLAAGIWDPISDYVGDRQVVVVPHSQLAWVPWPLLPPLRGRPVTVAPSAESWWRAATRDRARGTALVAAGPALHRARGEVEQIAELYPGAHLMHAEESDPELILQALDGASVAHLAVHGHHEPDNVLFSRLDFAHGPLNAYELLDLDQPPAHIVLSACDLGRSTVAVGNETLGFTAALLHAGTSTVVASLGRVPDDLAAEMMIDYHRRCAAGAAPAEALAAVGEDRPWHPFVCFGS